MGRKTDDAGVAYAGKTNCFVSHATAHTSFLDYDALQCYQHQREQEGDDDASEHTLYYFIDVFALNQNTIATHNTELPLLEDAVRDAGGTVLVFDRWSEPTVIKRIW
jgi:hypothetical protein